ncbi:MAG TPA: WXG100 family type VII secretion target [Yaniella sp.]|jgi:WXG100 family type VII secretion target
MARIQIDVQELFAKASGVQSTADRIQSEVNTMDAALRQLQESWVGQASSNFQSVVTEWRATQQRVEESLRSIREAMQHAGQQYESTEQANAAMFRG